MMTMTALERWQLLRQIEKLHVELVNKAQLYKRLNEYNVPRRLAVLWQMRTVAKRIQAVIEALELSQFEALEIKIHATPLNGADLTKQQRQVILGAVEEILYTALTMTGRNAFQLLALDEDVIFSVITLSAAMTIAPCTVEYSAEIGAANLFQPALFDN